MHGRFLADEMLHKLVRFMRIFGIPVSHVGGKTDEQILALVKKGRLTLLTSDEELARRCRKRGISALYLPQGPAENQVLQVLLRFKLKLPPFPGATLCPKCGGKLRRVPKSGLLGRVFRRVLDRRRLFWKCPKCSHIYWSGTHYARLKKARDGIARKLAG